LSDINLSVVIPLFNKQESVIRAVNSVLNQTKSNYELIIVNDGSTDDSLLNLNNIPQNNLTIISQTNKGVSAARNEGVLAATSNYVCFLDADDEWLPGFLAEIEKQIHISPDSSLYCTGIYLDNEFTERQLYAEKKFNIYSASNKSFYQLFRKNTRIISSSSMCVNKKYFNKIGGFPEGVKYGEDIYLWLKLADMANVSISNKKLAIIHRDAENRAGDLINDDIGYHVSYFLGNGINTIKKEHQKDLIKFVIKSAALHALQASLAGKHSLARKYVNYIRKDSYIIGSLTWLATLMPKKIITMAKSIRNP